MEKQAIKRIASTDELRRQSDPSEWNQALAFGSDRRRSEWLAWRQLLRSVLGRDVSVTYTSSGAPHIEGHCLSVSHAGGYVAVAVSASPCGIDIERRDRRFSKISSHYISATERLLEATCNSDFEPAVWCAKEAVFKLVSSSGEGITSLSEVTIIRATPDCSSMTVRVATRQYEVKVVTYENLFCAVAGAETLLAVELSEL